MEPFMFRTGPVYTPLVPPIRWRRWTKVPGRCFVPTRAIPAGSRPRTSRPALQAFPPAKPRVQVVPEFNIVLVLFPAQEHLAAADDGREINQPALEVFDENLAALEFGKDFLHIRQGADPVVYRVTADVVALSRQAAQAFVVAVEVF